MENRGKVRFPRTLLSPFASCKAHKLISDVMQHHHDRRRQKHPREEPIIPYSSTSLEPLLPTSSPSLLPRPKPFPCPSICRPRCPQTLGEMIRESCILSIDRRKIPGNYQLIQGMTCPPASPASPVKVEHNLKQGTKKKKKKKKKQTQRIHFSSSYEDWFSSDDEREEYESDTEAGNLFSDTDSFGSGRIMTRRKPPSARRREARKKRSMVDLDEKVKGSFTVVKRSNDPYYDFRGSMAEMIMEKQIFEARELEQLLHCFLSLNSPHHHRVIVQVFAEICDALFFNRLGL